MEKVLISSFIRELQRLQIEHGDLPMTVTVFGGLAPAWPYVEKEKNVIQIKEA